MNFNMFKPSIEFSELSEKINEFPHLFQGSRLKPGLVLLVETPNKDLEFEKRIYLVGDVNRSGNEDSANSHFNRYSILGFSTNLIDGYNKMKKSIPHYCMNSMRVASDSVSWNSDTPDKLDSIEISNLYIE